MSDRTPAGPQPTRAVPLEFKTDGSVEALTFQSPTEFKIGALIEVPPMKVIPVVFLPGIMGSNLRKRSNPKIKVWHPPNNTEATGAVREGMFENSKDRQLAFIPDEAEVDPDGLVVISNQLVRLSQSTAKKVRGWGTVHYDSYGSFLTYLEQHLNRVFPNKVLDPEWMKVIEYQNARQWGSHKPNSFDRLDTNHLALLSRVHFPVYAVGYNWLQSNEKSAEYLSKKINEIFEQWPKPHACNQVLMVTHSMGGLVARRCSQLIPDKILGIVHGVMPALGAAATYKRMKAGFEGPASPILGSNETEATASISNAAGPLELLPQPNYNHSKPWLHFKSLSKNPNGERETQWLPASDPYADIYEKDAKFTWYGLVNSDLIDPAKAYNHKNGGPWSAYIKNLKQAQSFHQTLDGFYHPNTRAYYGADADQMAWGSIGWDFRTPPYRVSLEGSARSSHQSDGTGMIQVELNGIQTAYEISKPDAIGDGTVPADASGGAPANASIVQQCYRLHGFDHQFAFNNDRVRLVVLHSLAKIAQRSPLVGSFSSKRSPASK